jgi:type IV pilus assembly protein PilC
MAVQLRSKKPVKPQEIADLSRQLAAFLRAGIPLIEAIDVIVSEAESESLRNMLRDIGEQLREGEAFSDAVARHGDQVPTYYPGIVRSAELSGRLDVVLEQLAEYIDRDQHARRRVKSALTYPTILGLLSVATVVVLVGFVLPKFQTFFVGLGSKLPLTTRILLGTGNFAKHSGVFVMTGASMSMLLVALFLRSDRGRAFLDRLALKVPVVRRIVEAAVIERFCRILGAMISGGIPIADGMTAAIESCNNRVFGAKLVNAAEEMLEGAGFAGPIARTGLFPGMVTQMMRVGEDTGTLDRQLEIAAEYHERELTFRLEKLTAMFEPAIIVAMGLVVGFVAVALVQAMYGVYGQTKV